MAEVVRSASAEWKGGLQDGQGSITTDGSALKDTAYSFVSRFQNGNGTNPEELLAAAHAACFSMMLSKLLTDKKLPPKRIATSAKLTLETSTEGAKITKVHLDTEVSGEGISENELRAAADQAKEQCPVSVLLKPGLKSISMVARLGSS
jgi:lipoyl-dependent peroxiredoxin